MAAGLRATGTADPGGAHRFLRGTFSDRSRMHALCASTTRLAQERPGRPRTSGTGVRLEAQGNDASRVTKNVGSSGAVA
jgi:hypothetical protein